VLRDGARLAPIKVLKIRGEVVKISKPFIALALFLACTSALGRPELNEINFAKGKSAATLDGSVVRGEVKYYTLRARKGQRMSATITAPENNAVFRIYRPGYEFTPDQSALTATGASLQGAGETDDSARWEGELPSTGKYLIVVGATRGNTTYRLNISVR
jgi:hypothetical protein